VVDEDDVVDGVLMIIRNDSKMHKMATSGQVKQAVKAGMQEYLKESMASLKDDVAASKRACEAEVTTWVKEYKKDLKRGNVQAKVDTRMLNTIAAKIKASGMKQQPAGGMTGYLRFIGTAEQAGKVVHQIAPKLGFKKHPKMVNSLLSAQDFVLMWYAEQGGKTGISLEAPGAF
jgi:hypothetical protein